MPRAVSRGTTPEELRERKRVAIQEHIDDVTNDLDNALRLEAAALRRDYASLDREDRVRCLALEHEVRAIEKRHRRAALLDDPSQKMSRKERTWVTRATAHRAGEQRESFLVARELEHRHRRDRVDRLPPEVRRNYIDAEIEDLLERLDAEREDRSSHKKEAQRRREWEAVVDAELAAEMAADNTLHDPTPPAEWGDEPTAPEASETRQGAIPAPRPKKRRSIAYSVESYLE